MVIVEDSGDWDTERKTDPRDMLFGRVFGGLPNGRLGRRSIKAGGSAGNSVLRVDPVTEPSTPSSSSADLTSFNTFPRSEGWSAASRGQEAAAWPGQSHRQRSFSGRSQRPREQQVNLADSAAWLFIVGPVLGEGTGVLGGGAVAAAVLDAPVPVSASVDNTAGGRGGRGGRGGGAKDAPASRTTNGFVSWFRSPRSPSPGTGRMCRAMRAVSATLSSLVCPCFERMYDYDNDDDGQSDTCRERE
ncbi:hypothetical protein Esi_0501_0015 [Ectocarpus siliculosus]|uniref:Uncharacterized protein n=2 Tax=Ectocarpus siliculosus TaxID=2880 RepID=D7G3B3_ECTSI|nr:hypothetical protein Esi_0501_0015 [Ectocarpus siliculosus]|eukprot:CBJ33507.1 hypothetical protein Esi_0501_0015 [Ectocarpus siliculosus]